jgi:hypothetical protein
MTNMPGLARALETHLSQVASVADGAFAKMGITLMRVDASMRVSFARSDKRLNGRVDFLVDKSPGVGSWGGNEIMTKYFDDISETRVMTSYGWRIMYDVKVLPKHIPQAMAEIAMHQLSLGRTDDRQPISFLVFQKQAKVRQELGGPRQVTWQQVC